MQFTVAAPGVGPGRSHAVLERDNWDDFGFKTLFHLSYYDRDGKRTEVGGVKIGKKGMNKGSTELPRSFSSLSNEYFSLGLDIDYYGALAALGEPVRSQIVDGLRDLAREPDRLEELWDESVLTTSLLRTVAESTVRLEFNRLLHDGSRHVNYAFSYTPPGDHSTELTFSAKPESEPPSNIHVLIGRNGVGKTYTLYNMSRAFQERTVGDDPGEFKVEGKAGSKHDFAGLVSVAFSAFDPFLPSTAGQRPADLAPSSYVGLKHMENNAVLVMTPDQLADRFAESLAASDREGWRDRWKRTIRLLGADPVFADYISQLVDPAPTSMIDPRKIFKGLSSGHKIVLLTITRLVETVRERTLVLIDEPESHLHPPLLSAFIRTLSELMGELNGLAIIATHSPVVLQEAPKSCVWKIERLGHSTTGERPTPETFGENVGVLTREVFGLEVRKTGFHHLISEAVGEGDSFEEIISRFGGQLGTEASFTARALTAERDATDAKGVDF